MLAWEADNAGKTVVLADEHALAERCAAAIDDHPKAREILRATKNEQVVTWTDPATGIACKMRGDAIAPTYLADLKSTRRKSLRRIFADFAEFLYHGQIAWYHDGAVAAGVLPQSAQWPYAVAVQTAEPFDVAVVQADTFTMAAGRNLYRSLIQRYAGCVAADMWPGIAPDVVPWMIPSWAQQSDDTEEMDW